jgi:hypothetical protein
MKQIFSRFLPLAALLVLLAGCAAPPRLALAQRQIAAAASAAQSAAAAVASSTVTSTATSSSSTAVSTSSTASPTERRRVVAAQTTASTSTTPAGTDTSSLTQAGTARSDSPASAEVTAAVKKVIQQADDEQQAAFTQHDATLMRDTATASYYQELVQTNRDMANSGVASIKLLNLQWGSVSELNSTNVRATTNETWQTALSDGTVDQSTDLNVYTLVLQNGSWKIATDDHPNADSGNPGSGASGQPGTAPNPGTQPAPLSSGQSHNWSGYAATGGTYTAVSGTWTVPQVAATSAGSDATWVGIGGVESHDLIQAGTEATASGAGDVQYEAWIELLPRSSHPVPLTVTPGDSVTVSLTQQSTGNWLVAFKDNTTGQTYQTPEQYDSSLSSAEWVEEAPSGGRRVLALDQFGTVTFSAGSTVKDGATDTIAKAGGRAITMADFAGQPVAKPSALGADGSSFTVTRLADSTPAQPSRRTAPGQLFPGGRGNGNGNGSGIGQGLGNPWPSAWQGGLS